jgi:hypothetical protein
MRVFLEIQCTQDVLKGVSGSTRIKTGVIFSLAQIVNLRIRNFIKYRRTKYRASNAVFLSGIVCLCCRVGLGLFLVEV